MSDTTETLNRLTVRIRSLAGASTADLIGIAPGTAFSTEELGNLEPEFGLIGAVVVLAQRIVDPVQTVRLYSGGLYQDSRIAAMFGDALLRDACWRVVDVLRDAGHRAVILRNMRYGANEPRHHISYKKAAVLAGLGAIGRNNLLIHPEHGPWLLLRAVLTDAALAPDAPIDFSPCDGCGLCITACPSGALTEGGFDRGACEGLYSAPDLPRSAARRISPLGRINCEECMRACPIGVAPPRLSVGSNKP
jgi:ferredoxin